jgi:hypothetical protein
MKGTSIILAWLFLLMVNPAAMAEEEDQSTSSHALKALEYGSKAIVHGSVASVGAIAMSGKAVSAVAAIPVGVSGKVVQASGKVLEKSADALESVADEDFNKPLPISDVSVTVGVAPDVAMQGE